MDSGAMLGSYWIESLIGRGGMAEVYTAWHTELQRREAVKVLLPQMALDASLVQRFLTVARPAARLQHPHAPWGGDRWVIYEHDWINRGQGNL